MGLLGSGTILGKGVHCTVAKGEGQREDVCLESKAPNSWSLTRVRAPGLMEETISAVQAELLKPAAGRLVPPHRKCFPSRNLNS